MYRIATAAAAMTLASGCAAGESDAYVDPCAAYENDPGRDHLCRLDNGWRDEDGNKLGHLEYKVDPQTGEYTVLREVRP